MTPKRILIANRGEIAVRVIRACREMGHTPLAIYSTADRLSAHVARADMAHCVGDGPSIHSYLVIEHVIKAAEAMKADAIHPGYGFLSENANFARAVEDAGIVFIGPTADVITKMGDKVMARKTMAKVGLPLVPGTPEGLTDENEGLKFAREIGFPIMIKAVAGGGGRGMRLVQNEGEFRNLFQRAFSEASKAFGDGRLYLERYVSSPHHIEVQLIADKHGNVCHLFERECSVQRRHQKVIEESPSPYLTTDTREKLCKAAVSAARDIGYVNVGTIEFLVDEKQNFYFMEMNTRLQVEHPVTEWVTGIDLVKEQIRVAFGEKLSFRQEDIRSKGHAIEFRICAEDPEKFLPQAGRLRTAQFAGGLGVRVDTHVYRGYDIPVFYDSMIAKLSVWGRDRQEAIHRGRMALRETTLTGVKTNVPLHIQLLENEKFVAGNYTTKLIGESFHYQPAVPNENETKLNIMAVAVSAYHRDYKGASDVDSTSLWGDQGRREGLRD
ncbi:MAG: acetyl-CoA carboxylase biotin carboxylase subunit [Deltaproteobacteria bacterium]|nr:acetyl-CoA carboxylase biotin carboxylase subunit [Deltaproteobacteria bacterium]MBI3296294.1 acetyl-CoA carboxylase biotin carboxylase subunit [Deltaproteobacteria bacterium]